VAVQVLILIYLMVLKMLFLVALAAVVEQPPVVVVQAVRHLHLVKEMLAVVVILMEQHIAQVAAVAVQLAPVQTFLLQQVELVELVEQVQPHILLGQVLHQAVFLVGMQVAVAVAAG
jgi:hypothetical protein